MKLPERVRLILKEMESLDFSMVESRFNGEIGSLQQRLSTRGPWTSSSSIAWELARSTSSPVPPQTDWIRNSGVGLSNLF